MEVTNRRRGGWLEERRNFIPLVPVCPSGLPPGGGCTSLGQGPGPRSGHGGSASGRSLPTSWAAASLGKGPDLDRRGQKQQRKGLHRLIWGWGFLVGFFFPLVVSPTGWETLLPQRSPAPGGDRSPPGRLGTGPLRPREGGCGPVCPGFLPPGKGMSPREASPPLPRLRAAPGPCAGPSHGGGDGGRGGSYPPRARGALSSRQPGGGSFPKFYSLFLIRANFYINGTCKRVRLPPVQTKGGRSLPGERKINPELTTCWKGILRAPIFT